jgi:hypothetical protein
MVLATVLIYDEMLALIVYNVSKQINFQKIDCLTRPILSSIIMKSIQSK